MRDLSCFDIVGPIMVGPSSSHTAGAVRLGQLAIATLGEELRQVEIFLHGSFAQTYKGHGTDKALVAGLLDFEVDDEEKIPVSFEFAKKKSISIKIGKMDLGEDYHENSVKFVLSGDKEKKKVIGSSTGGGNVKLTDIDEYKNLEITGEYETLFVVHKNKPGIIRNLCAIIAPADINIAHLVAFTENEKGYTLIYVNQHITEAMLDVIRQSKGIHMAILIRPLKR